MIKFIIHLLLFAGEQKRGVADNRGAVRVRVQQAGAHQQHAHPAGQRGGRVQSGRTGTLHSNGDPV